MLTIEVLQLALATLFTVGAMVIHAGERYASQITVVLSATATGLFMLTMIGGMIRVGDHAAYMAATREPGWVEAPPVARQGHARAPARVPVN